MFIYRNKNNIEQLGLTVKFKDSSAWVGIVREGKLDGMVEDRCERG